MRHDTNLGSGGGRARQGRHCKEWPGGLKPAMHVCKRGTAARRLRCKEAGKHGCKETQAQGGVAAWMHGCL